MKPEETILMVLAILKWNLYQEVLLKFNLNQSESAAGDGYAVKCCNNKLKTKDEEKSSRINGNVADLDVCKQSNIRGVC